MLPTSVQFPGWEMASFLQLWNPLALSSTMAFSRYAVDYDHDGEHYFVVLISRHLAVVMSLTVSRHLAVVMSLIVSRHLAVVMSLTVALAVNP